MCVCECVCVCVCVCVREQERERETETETEPSWWVDGFAVVVCRKSGSGEVRVLGTVYCTE